MDFRNVDLATLVAEIGTGDRSAEQLMSSTLARIRAHNPRLNAFVALADEAELMQAARRMDARIAAGEEVGPLAGVPVAVKDLEDAAGLPTTFGSALWRDAAPAMADSIEVERMRAAGALVVGKTNTPEFGCRAATDNTPFGATLNPWNTAFSPGGSSGGSAAALAAGLVPLATGSDGGGSIRIPAALCGMAGFKPSQGVVPMGGAPTTGLLAVRGPMTRQLRDTVLALDVVRGDASADIFALPTAPEPWLPAFDAARDTLPPRVIWCPTLGYAEIDREVLAVCEARVAQLEAAGVEVIRLHQIFADHPVHAWWTLWTTLLARKLEPWLQGPQWDQVDPPLQAMVRAGLKVNGIDFARAIDACHAFNDQLEQAFAQAPLILSPTCAGRAPKSGADGLVNGVATPAWVELTFGFNLTRHPAVSLFAGTDPEGLPVGLQVVGRPRQDLALLCAAGAMERLFGGAGRAPGP